MTAPRILVVDDEPDMRLAIGNVLRLRGYEVLEAGEGTEALELLSGKNISLVLLDMRLPGMSSLKVLEKARELKGSVPVVMVMGYGHVHSTREVLDLGASEYLQKPFENSQLVEVVKKFTSGESRKRPDTETPAPSATETLFSPPQLPRARETSAAETPRAAQTAENDSQRSAQAAHEVEASAVPASSAGSQARPATSASKRQLGFYALAVLFAAGGLALLLRWNAANAEYRRSYPARSANISALVWRGNELWAGDWVSGSVYRYAKNADKLELVAQYPLGKTHISSLVIAGERLYVWDSWKKVMEIRRLDSNLTLINSVSLSAKITGLAYDGSNLWSCDEQGVVALRGADGSLPEIKTYRLAERPDQIYREGNYLWTAVSSNGRFSRRRVDGGLSPEKAYMIRNTGTDHPLSAFTWRGGRLWFAMDGKSEITEAGKANLEEMK